MNNTNVKVGTGIVAKVGCNEVKAVITEIGENGIMARSHKSGKEFRVKTILQVISAPEVIRETPKPEKKLSLFSAAIKVMETGPAGQTYSVKELVAETIAQGLWTPGAGKTPDMTLYAAILRDIATKEHPRIVRASQREGSFTPENNLNISYRMPEAAAAFFVYRKGNNNHFSIVSIIEKMHIFCYFCLTNITDDVTTNCTFHPGSKDKKLIQVSWKMSDPSKLKREIEAFQSAAEYLNATEKLIVTWDEEKTLENNIKVIPAWKFLLEKY